MEWTMHVIQINILRHEDIFQTFFLRHEIFISSARQKIKSKLFFEKFMTFIKRTKTC